MSGAGENIDGEAPAAEPEAVADEVTEHADAQLERTIGLPADQVAERCLGPVLVVQREPAAEDED